MVTEFLPKGDIHHLIHNSVLSKAKILQMACDVIEGMTWLHNSKPPIIHRDIKPNNLLVDENYNVKICDFGLSAYNPLGVLKSQSTPGTPLWMSPEVLRGESITEKTDVYSFGIVLWEMYTAKDPFDNHDDIEVFIHAICVKQERPPLDDIPPIVANIISDCWKDDAKKRPRFDALIPRVREAIVEVTLDDKLGSAMWKNHYSGQNVVGWEKFVIEFYKSSGETIARDRENDSKYKCLKEILTHQSAEGTHLVSIERFGTFLSWFGPMGPSCLTAMNATMSQPWFHGDIAKIPCEALLNGFNKRGYYIVRLSSTDPVKSPYTISVFTKTGVEHLRVSRTKQGVGYYTTVKIKDKNKKIEEMGPIQLLINKWAKPLGLKSACPGSVYLQLCKNVEATGYQQYDDSED